MFINNIFKKLFNKKEVTTETNPCLTNVVENLPVEKETTEVLSTEKNKQTKVTKQKEKQVTQQETASAKKAKQKSKKKTNNKIPIIKQLKK